MVERASKVQKPVEQIVVTMRVPARIAAADRHYGVLGTEMLGDRQTDAGRPASDECSLAGQLKIHVETRKSSG